MQYLTIRRGISVGRLHGHAFSHLSLKSQTVSMIVARCIEGEPFRDTLQCSHHEAATINVMAGYHQT